MQGVTPAAAASTMPKTMVKSTGVSAETGKFAAVLDQRSAEQNNTPVKRSNNVSAPAEEPRKGTRAERKENTREPVRGALGDSTVPGATAPGTPWRLDTSSLSSATATGADNMTGGDPNEPVVPMQIGSTPTQGAAVLNSGSSLNTSKLATQAAGAPTFQSTQQMAWGNAGLESAGLSNVGGAVSGDQEPTSGDSAVYGTVSSDPAVSRGEDGQATTGGPEVTGNPGSSSLGGVPADSISKQSVPMNQVHAEAAAQGEKAREASIELKASAVAAHSPKVHVPGMERDVRDGAGQGALVQAGGEQTGMRADVQAAVQGSSVPDAAGIPAGSPLGRARREGRAAISETGSLANNVLPENRDLSAYSMNADGGVNAFGLDSGAEQDYAGETVQASTPKRGQNSGADLLAGGDSAGVSTFGLAMGTAGTVTGSSGSGSGLNSGLGVGTGDKAGHPAGATGGSPESRIPGDIHAGGQIAGATLPSVNTARLMSSLTQSEMRVGVRSAEFGSVTVHTAFGRETVSAQISLENAQLGTALSAHLPSIEQKLAQDHGLRASVTLHTGSDAASGNGNGSGPGAQGERGQTGQSRRGITTHETGGFWPTAEISTAVLTPSVPLSRSGQGRLDIRI